MQIHVVQSGESLWLISQRYKVSWQEIAVANKLPNASQLVVGQALVIPLPVLRHTVQPGENLWHIARLYGTTVQDLMRENRITNPALIYPGTVLKVPRKPQPVTEVNAYVQSPSTEVNVQAVRETTPYLTYLSPFSYTVKEDGSFTPLNDTTVLEIATSNHVQGMMVITNFAGGTFHSEIAHAIFASTQVQDRLLTNIENTMRAKGYSGLNIDFEYIFPYDRVAYNNFLRRAVSRLRPAGYFVSSALAPKQSAAQKGLLYEAHDYPVHGEVLDFTILMTYEWGWSGGPPMAVAPINQVRKVLDYAVSVIPRKKILMGMPLYGYDWTLPYVKGGEWAPLISPQEAIRRAEKYHAAIQYDPVAQSPFFHYYDEQGKEHEVWFEDARSVQVKFNTVKEYGLRGVSYWVLGNPFPQNWLLLEDNFQIRKKG